MEIKELILITIFILFAIFLFNKYLLSIGINFVLNIWKSIFPKIAETYPFKYFYKNTNLVIKIMKYSLTIGFLLGLIFIWISEI